jgi:N-methylhydantoinase B
MAIIEKGQSATTEGLLRDMTATEFTERYVCDRFVASVLSARFSYIIQHMCSKLQVNAFSPILRDSTDFCATLSGPAEIDWLMPAVSQTLPLFYGAIPDGVRVVMDEIGMENLEPGDVFIVNDSYRVGTHLNDVSFMRPVFHGDDLTGVLNITAHQLDFGGRVKGGFDYTKTSSYEDGLCLPPTLLFRGGVPVQSTFSLIEANTRLVHLVLPDIRTIGRCLEMGESLLLESLDKYGREAYLGAMRYTCDASAERMRVALEQLSDGVFEAQEILDGDNLPDSPEYVVKVRIAKSGGRAEFDFSGTSHAMRSALNCTWADAKTGVAMALKMLLDPQSPFTSGTLRYVDVVVPPGTMFNPLPPTCTLGYTQPIDASIKAIFKALNPVLGPGAASPDSWSAAIHTAEGTWPSGRPWYVHATSGVGSVVPWGATLQGDGDSQQKQSYVNMLESGIEPTETEMPVVVMRRDVVPDTGGPGYFRGGASTMTDSYWLLDGRHNTFMFHAKRPTGGVYGARPGVLGGGWVFRSDGTSSPTPDLAPEVRGPLYRDAQPLVGVLDAVTNELDPGGTYRTPGGAVQIPAGSVVRYISNGAGGWGDPFTRSPDMVLKDVRDEYVSIAGAARDYGVVIHGDPLSDPEGLTIDGPATARRRAGAVNPPSR